MLFTNITRTDIEAAPAVEAVGVKTCPVCCVEKPATVEAYGRNHSRKDGLNNRCKQCTNDRQRFWYATNKADPTRERRLDRANAVQNESGGKMKLCPACDQIFPATKEHFHHTGKAFNYCKKCQSRFAEEHRKKNRPAVNQRQRNLRQKLTQADPVAVALRERGYHLRKYGLTLDCYAAMMTAQSGVCAICASPPGAKPLHVDHHHGTGKVRALLCSHCNTMLGLAKDSPARLRAAADYLERHAQ